MARATLLGFFHDFPGLPKELISLKSPPSLDCLDAIAPVSIAKMQYYRRMTWIVELLDARVRNEVEALPADMRARFRRIVELIQTHGPERMREPLVKHLEGSLWEMRMKGKDGISRAIYVTAGGRRVVVVRAFIKKTERTPRREIELALQRAKEVNP